MYRSRGGQSMKCAANHVVRCMLPAFAAAVLCVVMLGAARSADADEIYVENECFMSFRIAIRYLDEGTDNWKTRSWWHFEPYEEAYLASKGKRLRTNNNIIYYYAKSDEFGYVWEGTDRIYKVGKESLGFRRHRDTGYDVDLSLGCTNIVDPIVESCRRECIPHGGCWERRIGVRVPLPDGEPEWSSETGINPECDRIVTTCISQCSDKEIRSWKENNRK